jgi:hypothetical protein
MRPASTQSKTIFQMRGLILLAAINALFVGIAVSAAVPRPSSRAQGSQSQPAKLETFRGEISPDPDTAPNKVRASSYQIYDESRETYLLVDSKDEKKPLYDYEGTRVEITGTLDAKSGIVHVESIKSIGWDMPSH